MKRSTQPTRRLVLANASYRTHPYAKKTGSAPYAVVPHDILFGMNAKKHLETALQYSAAMFLASLFVAVSLQLWQANLETPLFYQDDYIFLTTIVQSISESGGSAINPRIGAPFGGNFLDFPGSDGLHYAGLQVILWFKNNPSFAVNLLYLIYFPLTAATSLYTLRRFKIPFFIALGGALAFACLPFHFARIKHVFLSAYALIPLMTLVAVQAAQGEIPIAWRSKATWGALLVCFLTASSGIYYAFFSGFILAVLAVRGIVLKQRRAALSLSLMLGFLCLAVLINLLPTFIFQWVNGPPVVSSITRAGGESEKFGLKLIQLLLPSYMHRIAGFQAITEAYRASSPVINENLSSALGLIGAFGFLYSLVVFFRLKKAHPVLELLAFLNMACFLLGTTGGFGAVFAYFVSSQIRAYNRISVFIAFFAIFTVCWILNEFLNESRRAALTRISKILFSSILVLLVFVDQVPQLTLNQDLAGLESNTTFVHQLETVLPQNAMIFQLPYMTFPEHPVDLYPMFDYDLFKPYLLSTRLRWSYGGIKGRAANEWYQSTAQLPVEAMVAEISRAGFAGIYIDRYGYKELENNAVEQNLQKLLRIAPIVSPDQRLAFYDLRASPDSLPGGIGWH